MCSLMQSIFTLFHITLIAIIMLRKRVRGSDKGAMTFSVIDLLGELKFAVNKKELDETMAIKWSFQIMKIMF